jgi:hypothetical protein
VPLLKSPFDGGVVGPNGDSHHDGTARNENWWGYDEPIHAVADGEVTKIVDGIPENTPRVLPIRRSLWTTLQEITSLSASPRVATPPTRTYKTATLDFISTIKFMVEMSWVAWETAAMHLVRTCIFR